MKIVAPLGLVLLLVATPAAAERRLYTSEEITAAIVAIAPSYTPDHQRSPHTSCYVSDTRVSLTNFNSGDNRPTQAGFFANRPYSTAVTFTLLPLFTDSPWTEMVFRKRRVSARGCCEATLGPPLSREGRRFWS